MYKIETLCILQCDSINMVVPTSQTYVQSKNVYFIKGKTNQNKIVLTTDSLATNADKSIYTTVATSAILWYKTTTNLFNDIKEDYSN